MDTITCHEKYMNRCLQLARLGLGNTAPNPLVGSVIVVEDHIIGEGYHQKFGLTHAEVNAIESVRDKSLLPKSTLYVNLEPCSHTGKTPPCSDLIIRCKIPSVVIGTVDPHDIVSGRGINQLKNAGINTVIGVCKPACIELNKRFFTFHIRKRPYIILKWAQSQDGFMDVIRGKDDPIQPNWISGEVSRKLVHKWRSEEQAIMVGTNTALMDNPNLNVRDWQGKSPIRIVMDRTLRLPGKLNLFDNKHITLIINEIKEEQAGNCIYKKIPFDAELLQSVMKLLVELSIQSLIVEGGRKLLESFIAYGLWDEARIFTGRKSFGSGIPAPALTSSMITRTRVEEDELTLLYNRPDVSFL